MATQAKTQSKLEKKAGMAAGSEKQRPAPSARGGKINWQGEGKEVSAGPIEKWEKDKEVTGYFMRVRPLGNGNVMDIRTPDDELKTVGCPTILTSKAGFLTRGDAVRITCNGMIPTDSGQEAWDFSVVVLGRQDDLPF